MDSQSQVKELWVPFTRSLSQPEACLGGYFLRGGGEWNPHSHVSINSGIWKDDQGPWLPTTGLGGGVFWLCQTLTEFPKPLGWSSSYFCVKSCLSKNLRVTSVISGHLPCLTWYVSTPALCSERPLGQSAENPAASWCFHRAIFYL